MRVGQNKWSPLSREDAGMPCPGAYSLLTHSLAAENRRLSVESLGLRPKDAVQIEFEHYGVASIINDTMHETIPLAILGDTEVTLAFNVCGH